MEDLVLFPVLQRLDKDLLLLSAGVLRLYLEQISGFCVHRDRHLHHLALALLHLGRHLPCDAAVHGAF